MKSPKRRAYIQKLEKLSPQNGDVIVVRADGHGLGGIFHLNEELLRLRQHLDKTNRSQCALFLVGKDVKIEHISPEEMRKLGWARIVA